MQQWPGQQVSPAQTQQPAQPARAPGIIRGAPRTADPLQVRGADRADAEFDYRIQRDMMEDSRREQEKAAEAQAEVESRTRAESSARTALLKTIRELNNIAIDADDNSGWFETGTSGQIARNVLPGSNAGKDLAGNVETLNADFAFSALAAMREASKTGGALGNVTERELDLLKSSTANINPDLSHDTFLTNVERARQVYLSRLAMLDPQLATRLGYNSEEAEMALLELNEAYEKQFGDPNAPAPTINRDFVTQPDPNRTPEDIDAILKKYGVGQ